MANRIQKGPFNIVGVGGLKVMANEEYLMENSTSLFWIRIEVKSLTTKLLMKRSRKKLKAS